LNPLKIQDRQSRHEYIRAKNDRKYMVDEVDRALKAWASLHDNDSREIARETKYRSLLGILSKRHRAQSKVRDNVVYMYDLDFIARVDEIVANLESDRDRSVLVNHYRVFFDKKQSDGYSNQDKRDAWCREWGYAPNSYRKCLKIARDKIIEEIFK